MEPQRAYVPVTAVANVVEFDDDMMHVTFTDGRVLSVPLVWFPALRKPPLEQRTEYELGGGGISLHWLELDEDLSVAGLMAETGARREVFRRKASGVGVVKGIRHCAGEKSPVRDKGNPFWHTKGIAQKFQKST